jgi:hypothetical protein
MLAQLNGDKISVNIKREDYGSVDFKEAVQGQAHHWGAHLSLRFFTNKENYMVRVKILFVTMFVLSLFLMCGGCESERRERRDDRQDEFRDRQSEQDRHSERDSQLQEEHHEEQHERH